MSDISRIFERLNNLDANVNYIRGKLEAGQEHIATKDDVTSRIRTQFTDCIKRFEDVPRGLSNRAVIAIATAAGGSLALLIEVVKRFAG